MELIKIEPNMAITCKDAKELNALLEALECLGYVWYGSKKAPTDINISKIGNTIIIYNDKGYKNITHTICSPGDNRQRRLIGSGKRLVNFSELFEPELTAREALRLYGEICGKYTLCSSCPFNRSESCTKGLADNPDEAVKILKEWKKKQNKKTEITKVIEKLKEKSEINPQKGMAGTAVTVDKELLRKACDYLEEYQKETSKQN